VKLHLALTFVQALLQRQQQGGRALLVFLDEAQDFAPSRHQQSKDRAGPCLKRNTVHRCSGTASFTERINQYCFRGFPFGARLI